MQQRVVSVWQWLQADPFRPIMLAVSVAPFLLAGLVAVIALRSGVQSAAYAYGRAPICAREHTQGCRELVTVTVLRVTYRLDRTPYISNGRTYYRTYRYADITVRMPDGKTQQAEDASANGSFAPSPGSMLKGEVWKGKIVKLTDGSGTFRQTMNNPNHNAQFALAAIAFLVVFGVFVSGFGLFMLL